MMLKNNAALAAMKLLPRDDLGLVLWGPGIVWAVVVVSGDTDPTVGLEWRKCSPIGGLGPYGGDVYREADALVVRPLYNTRARMPRVRGGASFVLSRSLSTEQNVWALSGFGDASRV